MKTTTKPAAKPRVKLVDNEVNIIIHCEQKNGEEVLFSVDKTSNIKGSAVTNNTLSNFIANVLALSIDLSRLTNTNKPKLSKPITVDYSINGKAGSLAVKFSLAEKRIEAVREKLPRIMFGTYALYNLQANDGRKFTGADGEILMAPARIPAPVVPLKKTRKARKIA